MENKISTSIQYQFTNAKLFNEIFANWKNLNEKLNAGPNVMREWLYNEWNNLKEILAQREDLIVKDIGKKVTVDDFDITFNKSDSGVSIFFFKFPEYEYNDAASKYVALALTPTMPRYFTLEYSESFLTKERQFVFGEFKIDENTRTRKHINYGTVDNDRLTFFAGLVLNKVG